MFAAMPYRPLSLLTIGMIAVLDCGAARAQHVDENAVAASFDAFGRSVGSERTGLYSSEDVRGFNPIEAGNARIEGLYFDQIDRLSQRLLDGSTIRVGISAQHYPFPAPTGLVDYRLTKPDDRFSGSLSLEDAEYGGLRATAELKAPLAGEHLGLSLGAGIRAQQEAWGGGATHQHNYGGLLAWRPYAGAEIMAFYAAIIAKGEKARPTIFTAGDYLPPEIPRRRFFGQPWAIREGTIQNSGVIAKLPLGQFRLEAGLFDSRRNNATIYSDLLNGVDEKGKVASRTVIADGNNLDRSLSGEVRLVREWGAGALRHTITLSARGRQKERLFGGTKKLDLGASSALTEDFRPAPSFTLDPENIDRVRQFSYGLAYSGQWAGRGSFDASVTKTHYRKAVDFADLKRPDTLTRDNPLLWNVAASLIVTKRLALYAATVTGLEEAPIAPDKAENLSEAPPAIRTKQVEAGLRYAITPKLSFVGGVFSVKKPYYNLDTTKIFRQLGTVEHRGVELSLAGELLPGLSTVAGLVFIDPRISGAPAGIGIRPVGSSRWRSNVNLDWRLHGGKSAWSFDLAYDGRGGRVANVSNSFTAPARNTFGLGMKYRFKLLKEKALLRAQVDNVFNLYGWAITSSGGYLYSTPRAYSVQLLLDF